MRFLKKIVSLLRRKCFYKEAFLWLFIITLIFVLFSAHNLNSDEGVVLGDAWQIWHQQKMYLDFQTYLTPGAAYYIWGVWQVFGQPTYLLAKLGAMFLLLLSAVGVWLLAREISRKNALVAYGSVFLWLFACYYYPLINHNSFSSLAAVWLAYFLFRYIRSAWLLWLVLSGIAAGAVVIFLQTKGVILAGVSLVIILLLLEKTWQAKLRGTLLFLVFFAATLALLFIFWTPQALYYNLFIFPFRIQYLQSSFFFKWVIVLEIGALVWMFLSAYLLKNKALYFLSFFQLGLFASCFYYVSLVHFMINSFPLLIFALIFSVEVLHKLKADEQSIYIFFCTVVLSFALLALNSQPLSNEENILSFDLLQHSRGGIFDLPEIRAVENIYAGPFLPGLYFELKKYPHFRQNYNMAVCDQDCLAQNLAIFQRVRPEFAILNYKMVEKYGYNQDNALDNYIKGSYHYCDSLKLSPLEIYARDRCPEPN